MRTKNADLERFGWKPGNYIVRCRDCPNDQTRVLKGTGSKYSARCRSCAEEAWFAQVWDESAPTTRSGWMEAGV